MKKCSKCLQTRSAADFNRYARSPDGLQYWCRACTSEYTSDWGKRNRARRRESARLLYARDPSKHIEASRRTTIKREYGLTLEEYEQIIARGCAICGADGPRMALDHCHTTGKIRDALCTSCNNGLGRFMDDPVRLRAAADYLEKHARE